MMQEAVWHFLYGFLQKSGRRAVDEPAAGFFEVIAAAGRYRMRIIFLVSKASP
jgi:hypothetical protein